VGTYFVASFHFLLSAMSRVSRYDELVPVDGRRSVGHSRRSRVPDGFVSPIKRLIVCCDGEIALFLVHAPLSDCVRAVFASVEVPGLEIRRRWP
jgi:hypothetical protein